VKVEFKEDSTGESEWMWVRIEHADDGERVVFGQLDNEPVVNKGLRRGMGLAVSYDNIRAVTGCGTHHAVLLVASGIERAIL
jgi:hypothetical protein